MHLPRDVEAIGSLADAQRRELYEYIASQSDAVGREEAAAAVGIPVPRAKFHLERLVADGLLETEFRRLGGRRGPGAGRPAKLYRRAAVRFQVTLPERRYDLAGRILAAAIERSATGESMPDAVEGAARDAGLASGRALVDDARPEAGESPGSEARADAVSGAVPVARRAAGDAPTGASAEPVVGPAAGGELDGATTALARTGYEPVLVDGILRLRNCPFDPLAKEHTALICSMNRSYVQGVLDGAGCAGVCARLEPHAEFCCVTAGPES